MLKITGLTKHFYLKNQVKTVLKGVDLEVRRGQTAVLMGANGSGKTTLLKILSTLILPAAGKVDVFGLDLDRDSAQVRRITGLCTDTDKGFYPFLTLNENMNFFAKLYRTENDLSGFYEKLGLEEYRGVQFCLCSSGIKQRAGVMRALMRNPLLLLVDEPTKSLDEQSKNVINDLIKGHVRQRGAACLLVTHDRQEAENTEGNKYLLENGVLKELS